MASRSVGVASLALGMAWLSGWPSFVGVEGLGVAWPSCVGVEVPAMCLACSNPGGQTSPSSPGASAPATTGCPICGGVPCTGGQWRRVRRALRSHRRRTSVHQLALGKKYREPNRKYRNRIFRYSIRFLIPRNRNYRGKFSSLPRGTKFTELPEMC